MYHTLLRTENVSVLSLPRISEGCNVNGLSNYALLEDWGRRSNKCLLWRALPSQNRLVRARSSLVSILPLMCQLWPFCVNSGPFCVSSLAFLCQFGPFLYWTTSFLRRCPNYCLDQITASQKACLSSQNSCRQNTAPCQPLALIAIANQKGFVMLWWCP